MPRRSRLVPPDPVAAARVRSVLADRLAPAQAGEAATHGHVSAGDATPEDDPPESAARQPAVALRSGLLPRPLLMARWDPGRRGAAALAGVALLAALVTVVVVLRGRPQQLSSPVLPAVSASTQALPPGRPTAAPAGVGPGGAGAAATGGPGAGGLVVVAVAGKVRRPGLVRLATGARVDDAVRAAGGVLPGAGTGLLNLARPLVDGEQVLVGIGPPATPAAGGAVAGGGGGAAAGGGAAGGGSPAAPGSAAWPLDLNAATASDLDRLPGIGPVLAQRIVDWRTEHGRFGGVDQLREVSGIGESKYAALKAKVRV